MDTVKKVQNPYCGTDCQWRSARPRGGTSVRSRSWISSQLCNYSRKRQQPYRLEKLRRPRIFLRVGQRSKTIIDQRWEKYYLQDGQLRASCRSRVLRQFWKRFLLYIATTGLVEKRSGNSLWKQLAIRIKVILKSSIRAKWRNGTREQVRTQNKNLKRDDRKNSDDPLADLPEWLDKLTR